MGKPKRQDDAASKPPGKYKLAVSIDPQLHRRFTAYCSYYGKDVSAEVADCMRARIAGFRVSMSGPQPRPDDATAAADESPDLRVAS